MFGRLEATMLGLSLGTTPDKSFNRTRLPSPARSRGNDRTAGWLTKTLCFTESRLESQVLNERLEVFIGK